MCLRTACRSSNLSEDWDGFLASKTESSDVSGEEWDALSVKLDEIEGFLAVKLEMPAAEMARMREVLGKCGNPLRDPGSRVSMARDEERNKRESERKGLKKREEVTRHAALGSIFS